VLINIVDWKASRVDYQGHGSAHVHDFLNAVFVIISPKNKAEVFVQSSITELPALVFCSGIAVHATTRSHHAWCGCGSMLALYGLRCCMMIVYLNSVKVGISIFINREYTLNEVEVWVVIFNAAYRMRTWQQAVLFEVYVCLTQALATILHR